MNSNFWLNTLITILHTHLTICRNPHHDIFCPASWIRQKDKQATVHPLMEVFHDTATQCHLTYGITQCYLLPDTSEHTPP